MADHTAGPRGASVTLYDVGFGDCFLLTFDYGERDRRQVLIDCGTRQAPRGQMARVVDQVVADCGGHLDAAVVTHRHLDHLSGFADGPRGDKLEALQPGLVVQPWTEDPDVQPGDKGAPVEGARGLVAAGLARAARTVEAVDEHLEGLLGAAHTADREGARFLADLEIKNKSAVARLATMGGAREYLHAGMRSALGDVLPGVTVTVLGPPTPEQEPSVTTEDGHVAGETWNLAALAALDAAAPDPASAIGAKAIDLRSASPADRWLIRKLDRLQSLSVCSLLAQINSWINNTSLVLLFQWEDRSLLFSGDAQVENWRYALGEEQLTALVRGTTLYKVGHHGSGNATPLPLWELFGNRGGKRKRGRLVSLLSTDHVKGWRDVPCGNLLSALRDETDLHCTLDLREAGELSRTIRC